MVTFPRERWSHSLLLRTYSVRKKKNVRGGLKTGSQVTAAHLTATARVKDVKNRLRFTAGFFSLLHSINAMI